VRKWLRLGRMVDAAFDIDVDLSVLGQGDVGPFLAVLGEEIDRAGDRELAARVCTALKKHYIAPRRSPMTISLTGEQTEPEGGSILMTAFAAALPRFRRLGHVTIGITRSLEQ